MNLLSLITRGLLGSGDINVIKSYEIPIDIIIDDEYPNIEVKIEQDMTIEIYPGGANNEWYHTHTRRAESFKIDF